jgi:hypothetical protein
VGSFGARDPPLQLIQKVLQENDVYRTLLASRGFRHGEPKKDKENKVVEMKKESAA